MIGAIMQPYFFPYIGYYQLAYEAEKFVFLDDVNFIKKGYINRNAILLQGRRHDFSVPVTKISQNRHINDHNYTGNFSQFLSLIEQVYKKSPFFADVFPIVQSVALNPDQNVARKNANSIACVFSYLGIERDFIFSSDMDLNVEYKSQDRILALCQKVGINCYRNAIGGQALYDKKIFAEKSIDLKFIETKIQSYQQVSANFVPYLSIIDVLMHCDKRAVSHLLTEYSLV